jgi:hypothetical protein
MFSSHQLEHSLLIQCSANYRFIIITLIWIFAVTNHRGNLCNAHGMAMINFRPCLIPITILRMGANLNSKTYSFTISWSCDMYDSIRNFSCRKKGERRKRLFVCAHMCHVFTCWFLVAASSGGCSLSSGLQTLPSVSCQILSSNSSQLLNLSSSLIDGLTQSLTNQVNSAP